MNITIVGPGALGCFLGVMLARRNHDVLMFDHKLERVEHIRENGIRLEGDDKRYSVGASTDPKDASKSDLVLICVKAYNTKAAVAPLASTLADGSARILTLQNGIGNIELLVDAFGEERVWGGITSQGATALGPGYARHAGRGDTIIGAFKPENEKKRLDDVAGIFNDAGMPTRIEENVQSVIWSKLIINVGINALTAITRLRNGELLKHPETELLMKQVVEEAVALSEARGVKLVFDNPLERVRNVAECTAGNISSMLQDVNAKRKTEIDQINGAVAQYGMEMGVPATVNQALTNIVKTIEKTYNTRV